jgi:hypothetical protein
VQTAGELADRLEIFFGAASEAMCRVYARLENIGSDLQPTLTGTLTGPTCRYAETLPAVFSFVDRGPGRALLAEAVVPEPCFWTPAMPHLYRAEVQRRQADTVLAQVERTFGIRPLGASGRRLIYAGKGWVLRGAAADELPKTELEVWHDAETAMLARDPDDALCETASRVGVLLVAELETPDIRAIRRLSRWPAVGVICFTGPDAPDGLAQLGHNAILAQRFAAGEPLAPAPWAEAAICQVTTAGTLPGGFADCPVPIVAIRPAETLQSVAAGRAGCDRLQRDLAPGGQFAGYIV